MEQSLSPADRVLESIRGGNRTQDAIRKEVNKARPPLSRDQITDNLADLFADAKIYVWRREWYAAEAQEKAA